MTNLHALDERIAGAKEGSRELDAAFHCLSHGRQFKFDEHGHCHWYGKYFPFGAVTAEDEWHPAFRAGQATSYSPVTSSIDAALALVSRVFGEKNIAAWDVGFAYNGGPYHARIFYIAPGDNRDHDTETEVIHEGTPALAICLALVRALIAKGEVK